MKLGERLYGGFLRTSFAILNPLKKAIIKTECEVHKFINLQALTILRDDQHWAEYAFFSHFLAPLNAGTVWADQDFKSSSHFYDPYTGRGLYGRQSALELAEGYYTKALQLWGSGHLDDALFYCGAALHIVQDMVVPQHANVRLLDNHRQYENFVKKTYNYIADFRATDHAYLLSSIADYIKFNTLVAKKVYKRYRKVKDDEKRYYQISKVILPVAERTTAGCMCMAFRDFAARKKTGHQLN